MRARAQTRYSRRSSTADRSHAACLIKTTTTTTTTAAQPVSQLLFHYNVHLKLARTFLLLSERAEERERVPSIHKVRPNYSGVTTAARGVGGAGGSAQLCARAEKERKRREEKREEGRGVIL